MSVLSLQQRKLLEDVCVRGRRASEQAVRAAFTALAVTAERPPAHLDRDNRQLRRGLRAKARQLGDSSDALDLLAIECAYEQWHRLLFARVLAENNLLLHPKYQAPVTIEDCEDLASSLGEPDGWSVAARFAAEILPGIFRLDDPCVRLRLAPEGRLALESLLANLPAEVFVSDDALGWVYQFWQKDRKDEVNLSGRKIGGADLGPVTQLFTEHYMVRFLLENSLGAWWATRHPDSPLIKGFGYLRFAEDGKPAAGCFGGWPERVAEVTVMDPCCGSGHFLVEVFSMLWQMRAEEDGLAPNEAQDAVLRDNLFGLELDQRCVQIAMFAVALQAWKSGRGWRELPVPNIACSGTPVRAPVDEWTGLAGDDGRLEKALVRMHILFRDSDTLGSLIDPKRVTELTDATNQQTSFEDVEWTEIAPLLAQAAQTESDDPATAVLGASAAGVVRSADYLSRSYTLIATNVPYLSRAKQASVLRAYLNEHVPTGMADLATGFLLRLLDASQTIALVTPQSWQQQGSYKQLRRFILESCDYLLFARLGNNCWQGRISNPLFKFHTVLSIINSTRSLSKPQIMAYDIDNGPIDSKPEALRAAPWTRLGPKAQLANPEARIVIADSTATPLLSQYCRAVTGIQTGDTLRYVRKFWEIPTLGRWVPLQSTALTTEYYTGRSDVFDWSNGSGPIVSEPGAYLRNTNVWGSSGIAVKQMGDLHATLYTGDAFDNNVAVLIPHLAANLPAIWAFVSSSEYSLRVREVNSRPGVTTSDLAKVPFDIDRWQKVAEESGPLPRPSSNDPTQWLFRGRPEVSTAPLQVAMARLVGYRWPEQPESDALDHFADSDGIVCLPSVASEAPASDRLQQLLAAAYGESWSPAKARKLLDIAGSKKANLGDWLRDEFFKQHCALFGNRPFVWHVWDGLRDGFAAFLNYHRLDAKMLGRLSYTYLGAWIERQSAEVHDGIAGAEDRLAAALKLRAMLELILAGEPPYDIYVRWKSLAKQAVGWEPDLNDGVRLNSRPFAEAGILRTSFTVHWNQDRGTNADGSERLNDLHYTAAEKHAARGESA